MGTDTLRALDLGLLILRIAIPISVVLVAYLAGRWDELRHEASLAERERQTAAFPCVSLAKLPGGWSHATLQTGSVVMSPDLFGRFVAVLCSLVGAELTPYTRLLARGRREALARLKQRAIGEGCDALTNVRLETSRLAGTGAGGRTPARIELLAFGTGLRRAGD